MDRVHTGILLLQTVTLSLLVVFMVYSYQAFGEVEKFTRGVEGRLEGLDRLKKELEGVEPFLVALGEVLDSLPSEFQDVKIALLEVREDLYTLNTLLNTTVTSIKPGVSWLG